MPAVRSRGRADEGRAKPRPDAYVGLLGLSLVALTTAMVFAYLNWDQIKDKPKPVQMAPAGGGARVPAAPGPGIAPGGAAPGAAAPGGVPPGGNPPPPAPPPNK